MKRMWYIALALLCAAALLLSGCGTEEAPETSAPTQAAEETTEPETFVAQELPAVTIPKDGFLVEGEGTAFAIGESGVIRVNYNGNISTIRYVTSVDQLPDYPEPGMFDESYFRTHALLLIMETVSNGSTRVGISNVTVEGDQASVELYHETQGDMSTAVMTTWLIWAEVERDLDLKWTVTNPALESDTQTS